MPELFSDNEKFARLRLARSENIGPANFHALINKFGNAEDALPHISNLAQKGGAKRPIVLCPPKRAEQEWRALEAYGGTFIFFGEENYPFLLANIHDAPPVLSYTGNPELLTRKGVALVGARNASANGKRFTESLSRQLSNEGYCIVSGMARGIDGCAHTAAVKTRTIAVVAGGINHIYPPEHAALHKILAKQGGIMAEMPFGVVPIARHFPRRNRIISGLCTVTVAIEAGLRSGSLITAKTALNQGRDVGAVPGSPLDPRCAGTNDLLRQGITPITCADDVISLLEDTHHLMHESETPLLHLMRGSGMEESPAISKDSNDDDRTAVLNLLSATPEDIDTLADMCHLPVRTISCILLELELAGRVERHGLNKVSLIFNT